MKWYSRPQTDIQYVIVTEYERTTINPVLDERVQKLKSLLLEGFQIISSAGSLDGTVHYVLQNKHRGTGLLFWKK